MINFRPFRAVRPAKQKATTVTSRNIDYYNEEEMEKELATNDESFLQVLEPNIRHSEESPDNRFKKVRNNFERFLAEEILMRDNKSYYIYEQQDAQGNIVPGILGTVSTDDFNKGLIKKHENTLEEREKRFAEFLKVTHFQSDPVMLTFPENQNIELIMSMTTRNTPTLEFKGNDNKIHRLWQVKDRLVMKQLKTAIEKLPALYIADGHHRMGSSSLYTSAMRKEEPDFFGGEAFNYAMAILIPGNHLNIYDYNRMVTDLNGMTTEDFLAAVDKVFTIVEKGENPYFPSHKHHISMYLDGKFYGLYVNQNLRGIPKGYGELDTWLWEEHILKPLLGVKNIRVDARVAFQKGTGDLRGIMDMKEKVDSGKFKVAFGFYPIAISDLILIADEGLTMPPKSTYIEPKFLSALTILDLMD
ncbi:MAG: DUF1015 domain-containing protein [Flavobacteriaceae bacterium]|nr:DUF1015 domain-containing protein [Flavobacteriaceae bacterium]